LEYLKYMDIRQSPSDIPDLPPGTYEFVDTKKKRNWKKISEITAVLIIAAIPAIMSLFKVDYPMERVYEVVNPAYIGTLPVHQNWNSVITKTKELIKSTTESVNKNKISSTDNANTEQILITPTLSPSTKPSPTTQPTQNGIQPTLTPTPIQNQNTTPTSYPTESPATPTFTPVPEPTQSSEQQEWDQAFVACLGKKSNSRCSYFSANGNKIDGRCKISNSGYLTCIDHY
jgi:hypothetical protein